MQEEIRCLARRIFDLAGSLPCQVYLRTKRGLLVRFANNGVYQNNWQDLTTYTVRVNYPGGANYFESNDCSEEGIRSVLARAHHGMGKAIRFNRVSAKSYPAVREEYPLALSAAARMAGKAIDQALTLIRAERASANGYYSIYRRQFYFAFNRDRGVYHPSSAVRFGVTITKGQGKGYFSFYHPSPRKLDVGAVVRKAMGIAYKASEKLIHVPSGPYEALFSPWALRELVEPLRRHFDFYLARSRRSVLSNQLGRKIFSPDISLYDDIGYPGQVGVPFDAEGFPKTKKVLIRRGVLKNYLREGHSTRGLLEHPYYPQNLVLEKGDETLKNLFGQMKRGIFINKIWYPTLVRESRMEVTGLAAGGSLFIENGQIQGQVDHLRYHDSLWPILNAVSGISRTQILMKDGETGTALLPYLRVSRLKIV